MTFPQFPFLRIAEFSEWPLEFFPPMPAVNGINSVASVYVCLLFRALTAEPFEIRGRPLMIWGEARRKSEKKKILEALRQEK